MKYPYIGKGKESGTIVIMVKPGCGLIINSKTWAAKTGGFETSIDESYISNITHEYLSNTWGVVESKEHAEFVIELAMSNNLDIYEDEDSIECNYFTFNEDSKLFFYEGEDDLSKGIRKQITIPLPPKAKEWPQVGDAVTWGNKVCNGVVKAVDGNLAWIKNDHANYVTEYIDNLVKPKSKQQLKIEELQTKLCNNNAVDNYILACDIINGEIEGLSYEGE